MNKILGITALLFALNCKTTENKMNTFTDTKQIDVILIAKGSLYGSGKEGIKKQNLVITSSENWNELVAKMDSVNEVSNSFSETDIDFSKYSVIAVFNGVVGSGGHNINLAVDKKEDEILVNIISKSSMGLAVTVMNQPYYIAKIPKTNLPVVFNNK